MSRIQEKLEPDLFAPGARASDPETSHAAAGRNKLLRQNDRREALLALARSNGGMTDFELADVIKRQQTSAGKRRGELRDAGLVAATKERRPAPSGSPAIVWKITEAGVKAVKELGS